MNSISKYFLLLTYFSYISACDKNEQINSFARKFLNNNFPSYDNNPYENLTESESIEINKTIHDKNIVCAIQYTDSSKMHYNIQYFKYILFINLNCIHKSIFYFHNSFFSKVSFLQI